MWVRHFARRRRTQRYKDFRERYRAFLEEDIVRLCHDHHEEVHAEYGKIIRDHMKAKNYEPLRRWTWAEAEKLGDALEAFCKWWLKQETPGIKEHRLV